MTTLHFLLAAGVVWRVVKWRHSPRRRPAGRRGAAAPWLVALVSDAAIFGGLAYREHRRKIRAGKPTAVRDRRKSTWTKSTPLGGADGAVPPPSRRRKSSSTRPFDEIPF